MISAMRSRCPTKRILIVKTYLDETYRQIHTNAKTALTCIAISAMILRGNHKSSQSVINAEALNKAISKEIDHGWALQLTIESLQILNNAGVVPLGVAEQFSINEKGERYIKRRVTPDCSFPGPSGLLVNNRVQRESLQP